MIESFLDSALIIDDKKEEVEQLISLLENIDIWVKYYHPDDLNLKTRKIIFLDLSLDDSKSEAENISTIIRPMLSKNIGRSFGTYGIVLWTRHLNWVNEFKKRIQNDRGRYALPLFIVGLDKTKYLRAGNYDSIFDDLNKLLKENVAASFFIQWFKLVDQGKDNAISNIYSLVSDYNKQNSNLQYILFRLAQNYTGIPVGKLDNYPLFLDACRTFNDMMTYEVVSSGSAASEIFQNISGIRFIGEDNRCKKNVNNEYLFQDILINLNDPEIKKKHDKDVGKLNNEIYSIFSELNRKLLLDDIHISQNKIVPGNIYEIVEENNSFIIENSPNEAKPIIIEMTPPCDYSQEKMRNSKILGGFISKYSGNKYKEYKSENYYKEIWPLHIVGFDNPSLIIFDFRYFGILGEDDLKNESKYKILFRAKDKLFADILQKLTSYSARLGLNIIR